MIIEIMNVDPQYIIQIKYGEDIPKSVEILKPVLFREGNAFCCLLGPDPQEGIFGCGDTEKEALKDWDGHLRERFKKMDPEDAVIRDIIKNLQDDLW